MYQYFTACKEPSISLKSSSVKSLKCFKAMHQLYHCHFIKIIKNSTCSLKTFCKHWSWQEVKSGNTWGTSLSGQCWCFLIGLMAESWPVIGPCRGGNIGTTSHCVLHHGPGGGSYQESGARPAQRCGHRTRVSPVLSALKWHQHSRFLSST